MWPSMSDISIAMPLPVRRKFGRPVLYQPLFCRYLGIFSRQTLNGAQCDAFLEALKRQFPYISCYAFNPENFALMSKLSPSGFEIEVFQTHWLSLDQSYTDLRAGYSRDRKKNLKRGSNTAWKTFESDDFEPLLTLFAQNHAPGIGRIKAEAYRMLKMLGMECIRNDHGRLLHVRAGVHIRAGVLLTRYHGRAIYLFNAADHAGEGKCQSGNA